MGHTVFVFSLQQNPSLLGGGILYTLLSFFFFYSFLGFLLEVLYVRLVSQEQKHRKCFLLLPLCPVYGLGAVAILSMPPEWLSRPLLIFVGGGLLATLVEYAVSLFYEWSVGVRFWDYSKCAGNLFGRICPLYTFFWGILALVLVYLLHPLVLPLLMSIPPWVLIPLFLLSASDGLVSLSLLHRTHTTESLVWYRKAQS